jgi:hypothetical protein
MAIPAPLAEFILLEHARRPLEGHVLSLGRQTILFDKATLYSLMDAYSINRLSNEVAIDKVTFEARQSIEQSFITDDSFYAAFTGSSYEIMDVTDYEGATIIHNLCQSVPDELMGRFDFIFNGSVLDNIFDPAAAMRHITQMLSPHGRVMHIEMASNLLFEYLIYSPDWFLDYYVVNGFRNCRIYVCTFNNVEELKFGPWQVYAYRPRGDGNVGVSLREVVTAHAVLIVVAERWPSSTFDKMPIQWCYRDDSMKKIFLERYANFENTQPFCFRFAPSNYNLASADGFSYLGSSFQAKKA